MRLAQLDRAFGYGPKGRGFESSSARFFMHKYMSEISRMHFSVQPDEIGMMAEMLINEVFSFFHFMESHFGSGIRQCFLSDKLLQNLIMRDAFLCKLSEKSGLHSETNENPLKNENMY